MRQTTLRSVSFETVDSYRQIAEHALEAYRANGHKLLAAVNRSVERAATRGAERIAPRLAAALRRTTGKVTGVAAKGIDTVSAQTERVIEFGSTQMNTQVARVADFVERVDNRYVTTGLHTAARISLSGAQAALGLSEKLVAGADKLSAALGGEAAPRAKAVKRKVATRGRSAVKAVRKVAVKARAAAPKVKAKPARTRAAVKAEAPAAA